MQYVQPPMERIKGEGIKRIEPLRLERKKESSKNEAETFEKKKKK